MAVTISHKQSATEKRLKMLNQQLYGKVSQGFGTNQTYQKSDLSDTLQSSESFRTDTTYLKHDLAKIAVFASLAIGVQILVKIFFERG